MEIAKERVLSHMRAAHPRHLHKASALSYVIWPDHQMNSQGAGGAASRILRHLEKEGTIQWTSGGGDWGWKLGNNK